MVVLGAGCSVSGEASPPTTVAGTPSSTTSTDPPTTTSTTTVTTTAPPSTTTDPPAPPAPPPLPDGAAEEVAVGFIRDAILGEDLTPYVVDPTVAEDAATLWNGDAQEDLEVMIEPTYVAEESQGGEAGSCQLVGDVTLLCPVIAEWTAGPEATVVATLFAVYVTTIDPEATGPQDPLPPVDPYVQGFEVLAG